MKKLIIITLAAFAMTNCAKESVIDSDLTKNGNTIGFNSYSNITRGKPINGNDDFMVNGNSFGVTAFINILDNNDPYMGTTTSGAQINFDDSNWNYANKNDSRFWPTQGEKLDFYAYAPFDDDERRVAPAFDKGTGMTFTDYTVTTDVQDQKDFMYASSPNTSKGAGSTAVKLIFNHAMTQILFKVKVEDANLYVDIKENGITLKNIASKGTFKLAPGAEKTVAWSGQSDPSDYTVPSATDTVHGTETENVKDVFVATNTLMLLPQVFAKQGESGTTGGPLTLSCKIYYQTKQGAKQYLKGDADSYATIEVPFSSKDASGREIWKMNNKITYTLLINGSLTGLEPISFETDVEDWTNPDDGDVQL